MQRDIARLSGRDARSKKSGLGHAAVVAGAVFRQVAVLAISAFDAWSTAIDIGFRTIGDFVVACRLLTNSSFADFARAVEPRLAVVASRAGFASRSAAIDRGFLSIEDIIVARCFGAQAAFANEAIAVGIASACGTSTASGALKSAAIDVRFDAILDHIGAFGRCTHTLRAYLAWTMRSIEAFDAKAEPVTEPGTIAVGPGGKRPVLRRAVDTGFERAGIAIIDRIGEILGLDDESIAITNIALAIADLLNFDEGPHRGEGDVALAVDTGKRLTFAACAAVGVDVALEGAGARAARTAGAARSTAAELAFCGRASGDDDEGEEQE